MKKCATVWIKWSDQNNHLLAHEEPPQDDLVELGIGPPCQEPEKTWMTRENLGITKNETTLLTCRA